MGSQQIIPTITIDEITGLTVNSNVLLLITLYTFSGSRIQFYQANSTEIGAVTYPQTTCRRIQKKSRVYGIIVFHSVGRTYFNSFRVLKVWRFRIQCLVPHRQNTAIVSAAKSAAGSSIYNKVSISNSQHVGGSTSSGTYRTVMPCPSIFRDETTATSTEGVILTITFC